jgi:hypothetical protein
MSEEPSERMRILQMIESGRISAEQGVLLLQSLAESEAGEEEALLPEEIPAPDSAMVGEGPVPPAEAFPAAAEPEVQAASQPPEAEVPVEGEVVNISSPTGLPDGVEKWKRWWVVPLWIGVGVTVVGAALMYAAQVSYGLGLWFLCAALPFALGVGLMVLAVHSRISPWLHLRVQQPPGQTPQRIALSFPLPIRPLIWFLHTFGRNIQELDRYSVDEILLAVGQTAGPENPIYIDVNDEDGTHVEIFIG